jgi:hypothetical protein
LVDEANLTGDFFRRTAFPRVVRPAKCGGAPCGFGLSHFAEKMFVIVGLGAQDETHVESLQPVNVRCVTR